MDIARSQQGTVTVLSVSGPIVSGELGELDTRVTDCVNLGVFRIVLDLKNVPFVDSAGLEKLQDVIVSVSKQGGEVRLASLNDVCRDILAATRLDSIMQAYEDRDAAVRSLL